MVLGRRPALAERQARLVVRGDVGHPVGGAHDRGLVAVVRAVARPLASPVAVVAGRAARRHQRDREQDDDTLSPLMGSKVSRQAGPSIPAINVSMPKRNDSSNPGELATVPASTIVTPSRYRTKVRKTSSACSVGTPLRSPRCLVRGAQRRVGP